jgi:uncharacterized membrane protein
VADTDRVDRQDEINQREWEQLANWSGWFGAYSSRVDSRLWVPKRPKTGIGDTVNFGHPGAKTVVATMCIVPGALLLLLVLVWLLR